MATAPCSTSRNGGGVGLHFMQQGITFALFFTCLWTPQGHGKEIDRSPRANILLTKSDRFIALDAWNSLALYAFDDAEPIRRFPAGGFINGMQTTADEQLLLVACDNGEIGVWNIGSGKKLWWLNSSQSGLQYIIGASFSWDGQYLVASNVQDFAVVFDARTGRRIAVVSFPPLQTNIVSPVLSPDGGKGAFVTLGGHLYTFDPLTGRMKDTTLTGAGPLKYSADGKYLALRSENSGVYEQLRVVAVKDLTTKDVGEFSEIDYIKPTEDGGFLVCARVGGRSRVGRRFDEDAVTVGVECRPGTGELKEVWKLAGADAENCAAFDPKRMMGVSTDYRLVTRLIDLRTGKALLTIDNSANYRERLVTSTWEDLPWTVRIRPWIVMAGGIVALMLLGWLITSFIGKRKRRRPS